MANSLDVAPILPPGGTPRTYRIMRSGDKDLQFEGFLIGRGEKVAGFPDRPLGGSVYVTTSGKYVTQVEQGSVTMPANGISPSIPVMESSSCAAVHETPEQTYQ